MNITVPTEFQRYAREQVRAGVVRTEEEAVTEALRAFATQVDEVRRLIDPAIAEADRGETLDGEQFMTDLIETTRSASGE